MGPRGLAAVRRAFVSLYLPVGLAQPLSVAGPVAFAPLALPVAMASVVAAAGTLVSAGPAGASTPTGFGPVPPGTPAAHPFAGEPTVGPLFPPGSAVHTCTASVVDSRAGDLLVTATHCMTGSAAGYTFAPGYHDGVEPYGIWTVVGAYVDPRWTAHRAPQLDVAFLRVAPHRVDGHTREIQAVTGGNRLSGAPAAHQEVTVPAYAIGHDDAPITCTTRISYHDQYPAFTCNPYVGGTSGAPWLVRTRHGQEVVGVIGGLHQGGCYPWISYSAPFGSATARTYDRAARGDKTVVLPPPESDGCTTGL